LLLVEYAGFDAALNAAREMLAHEPGAIETADETVLDLARGDIIWHRVRGLFREPDRVLAINLVEFEGDDAGVVTEQAERLRAELAPR
ncbi:FAD-linked oxidase C-terminal domain-containing protein, partial [Klebsiella pneumoniae]